MVRGYTFSLYSQHWEYTSLKYIPKTMVIQLNSQMYQNRFKIQGQNQKLMIERTMDRGFYFLFFFLLILTQGPNHSQYGISLLANNQSLILYYAINSLRLLSKKS